MRGSIRSFGRNFVVGIIGEYGETNLRDNVTAFSTTPAFYTFERRVDETASIRGRAGFAFRSNTLVYATGGAVYAKLDNRFTSSNGVNTFTEMMGDDDAWGYRAGGGVEQRIGRNFSFGIQYLYTNIDNDEFTVRAGGDNVPVSNPFILVNQQGTDLRPSDREMDWHNVSLTASIRF